MRRDQTHVLDRWQRSLTFLLYTDTRLLTPRMHLGGCHLRAVVSVSNQAFSYAPINSTRTGGRIWHHFRKSDYRNPFGLDSVCALDPARESLPCFRPPGIFRQLEGQTLYRKLLHMSARELDKMSDKILRPWPCCAIPLGTDKDKALVHPSKVFSFLSPSISFFCLGADVDPE